MMCQATHLKALHTKGRACSGSGAGPEVQAALLDSWLQHVEQWLNERPDDHSCTLALSSDAALACTPLIVCTGRDQQPT